MILIRNNVERVAASRYEAEKLKEQGFKVLAGETKKSPAKIENVEVSKMTVSALRTYAKAKGLKAADALSKADLLKALKEMK